MIYEENIKSYERRYKKKYNALLKQDDTVVSKDISQNGNIIFSILFDNRQWFLNSKYDSVVMAKGWADLCEVGNDFSIIFIFGFANGDYINEISKKHPNNKIIVYEPSINIFDNNMRNIDLSFILNNGNISLFMGHHKLVSLEREVNDVMDYSNYSLSKMLILPNYDRVFQLECLEWVKLVEKGKQNTIVNFATEEKFQKIISQNIVVNIMDLVNNNVISNLIRRFRSENEILNRPAIVVSAGPSLDENVEKLKKAENKALIICVDKAVLTVIKAGIRPDIIITIDPNKAIRLFDIPEITDIPLVCDIEYNNKILDVYNGKRFYSFSGEQFAYDFLNAIFPQMGPNENTLETGGSVANSAFSLARVLGFKDIILIGQDLAYPGNKRHSEYAKVSNNTIDHRRKKFFEIEDIFGNKVLTQINMNLYKEWYEVKIKEYKSINVYDATEGGAKIKGTHIVTLEEIIKEKCESLEDIDFKNIIDSIEPLFSKEVSKKLIDEFLDTQNLLEDIRTRIKKIIRLYENLNKLNISGKQGTKQFAKLLNELKEEQKKLKYTPLTKLIEKFNVTELNNIQLSMYDQQKNEYEDFKYLFQKGIEMMEIYLKSSDVLENEIKKVAE